MSAAGGEMDDETAQEVAQEDRDYWNGKYENESGEDEWQSE